MKLHIDYDYIQIGGDISGKWVIVKPDIFEILKRLDENVKRLIDHKKSLLASSRTNSPDNLIRHEELFLQIDELESLDK